MLRHRYRNIFSLYRINFFCNLYCGLPYKVGRFPEISESSQWETRRLLHILRCCFPSLLNAGGSEQCFFYKKLYIFQKCTKFLRVELKIFQFFRGNPKFWSEIRRYLGNLWRFLRHFTKMYKILKSNKKHWVRETSNTSLDFTKSALLP